MGVLSSTGKGERGPFAALLLALMTFIGLVPIVDTLGFGGNLVRAGFTVVLIVGLGVARGGMGILGTAILLLVPTLILEWLGPSIPVIGESIEVWRSALSAGYLFYLVAILARTLLFSHEASLDTILGGINVYLVMALAFMTLHRLAESAWPGSYVSGGVPLSDAASHPNGSLETTLLYFSFTTLTTLGYGDIAPARPIAQFLCSAEAVAGQLFVAIFIGGLVALWVGGMKNPPAADAPPDEPPR